MTYPPPQSGGGGPREAWWRGRAGAEGSHALSVRLRPPPLSLRRGGIRLVLLTLAFAFLHTAPPALPSYAAARAAWRPSDAVLLDRHGRELGRVRTDMGARRGDWVPLAAISPALVRAAIAAEDRRFYAHHGVDWRAVGAAMRARVGLGGRPRGASTVTMQLAGLLAPELRGRGPRSTVQKIAQARAALAIERGWSKAEILEAWFNLAPSRGELVGVDAAARALFGVAPGGLSAPQSSALVGLLPAPGAARPILAARACTVARAAGAADCAPAEAAVDALLSPAPAIAPALAPQLAARLLRPGQRMLTTTLDADVQALAARALARRLADLDPSNARDGAAVVVDNASGEVLAYVASAGPASRAAEVDGADAPRQAGSTLKPFLYALAIGQRRLTAASVLDDSPVHLETASGLYVPQDYDRAFRGPVSVRSALGNSLNVPAVRALMLAGVDDFRETLHDIGYAHIVEEGDYYGYSLALGSAEVTLLEQAAAYRALANGGIAAPLRLTPGAPAPGRRVLGRQATAIVADILADPAARESTFGPTSAIALPFWAAVKTGTSKAMRDNWCIGFTSRFTVAVWVGNFEGDAMANVSGVTGAAPAWREIMLGLHPAAPARPALAAGLARARVRFAPAIEPPRDELFLPGTAIGEVHLADALPLRPRIVAPADGALLALDPDIPTARQRVAVRTEGASASARLTVDGRTTRVALWMPTPGVHTFALARADGQVLDRVRVTVR